MQASKKTPRFSYLEYGLILLCFSTCLAGALLLPVDQCPDEEGRLLLTDWIVQTGTLPTGNEPEVMIPGWGFSYALHPYLSAIIGAIFKFTAACLTDSPRILLAASRMCSVLSVTFCCFFCLRLGHRLFEKKSSALLLAVLVCFLPQVVFLGMYQNNDSLSLCAVSMMLYCLAEGFDRKWPVSSCVGVAVAFSIGLLSYYTIYGWLLMGAVFCVLAVLTEPEGSGKGRLILNRATLIFGICLLLAGWFFIRNACLHNGDILGFDSESISRAQMQEQGYDLFSFIRYRDEGLSVAQFLRINEYAWLWMTAESFIGVFGHMVIYLPKIQYGIYYAVLGGAFILFFAVLFRQKTLRRDRLLMLLMLLSGIMTLCLHFLHSYTRDFQPQGRYVITLILPFAYMLAYGADKTTVIVRNPKPGKAADLNPAAALIVLWFALFIWAALGTMARMIR